MSVVASATASTVDQASARTPTRPFTLSVVQDVVGAPDMRASVRTRISLPARWAVVRRTRGSLTLRERLGRECRYTIRVRSRVVAGPETSAEEHVRGALPARAAYVLGRGARDQAAWRVVRLPGDQFRPRIRAIRAVPLGETEDGRRLWVETRVSADSAPRTECHLGTYRNVVGPLLTRALAGTTTVARLPA